MTRIWRRRLADAVLIVLSAAALLAMHRTTPGFDEKTAAFPVKGSLGETVNGRSFSLRLDRVDLATSLTAPVLLGPPKTYTTSGVWVIVHGAITSNVQPMLLRYAGLRTRDGLIYTAVDDRFHSRWLLTQDENYAGISRRGILVFEVPPDRLAGAVLLAGERSFRVRLDSRLEIALGLDESAVRARMASAQAGYRLDGALPQ